MSTLPPELRSWELYLEFLKPDLVAPLARLAGTLQRGLGPRRSLPERAGEPNGWAGLSNRGHLERLLVSEWALADLEPDEFVRRASQGEQLYWQPEQSSNRPAGSIRLLLDSGPSQLGACRVVQLALLIVLSRQARERHCQLHWRAGGEDFQEISARSVQAFLNARSALSLTPEEVSAFQQAARSEDEVWVVGHDLQLSQSSLDRVSVRCARGSFELTLPPADVSARFLRNPLRLLDRQPVQSAAPSRGLHFDLGGRKLIVQTGLYLQVHPLPNSPRDIAGASRSYYLEGGGDLVALGMRQRTLVVVLAKDNVWRCQRINKADARQQDVLHWEAPAPVPETSGSCWLDGDRFCIQADEQLWSAPQSGGPLELERTGRAFLSGKQTVILHRRTLWRRGAGGLLSFAVEPSILVGYHGALAVESGPFRWVLLKGRRAANLTVPAGTTRAVVGDTLVLQDGPELVLHNERETVRVPLSSPVQDLAPGPAGGLLAYRLENGEVGVYSLSYRQFFLRLLPA